MSLFDVKLWLVAVGMSLFDVKLWLVAVGMSPLESSSYCWSLVLDKLLFVLLFNCSSYCWSLCLIECVCGGTRNAIKQDKNLLSTG